MLASMMSSSLLDLISIAQTQLHWWNQLIQVTGGEPNPLKCCGAIYTWQTNKLGIISCPNPNNHDKVRKTLSENTIQDRITFLKRTQGRCYLGVYISPDGSMKPMEHQLWTKAVTYTTTFQWMQMSHCEAGVLYQSCFLPSNLAPKPISQMHPWTVHLYDIKQDDHMLPRSMVFAFRNFGGVGLSNLNHKQGAQQVIILLWHLQAGTTLGITIELLVCSYISTLGWNLQTCPDWHQTHFHSLAKSGTIRTVAEEFNLVTAKLFQAFKCQKVIISIWTRAYCPNHVSGEGCPWKVQGCMVGRNEVTCAQENGWMAI